MGKEILILGKIKAACGWPLQKLNCTCKNLCHVNLISPCVIVWHVSILFLFFLLYFIIITILKNRIYGQDF